MKSLKSIIALSIASFAIGSVAHANGVKGTTGVTVINDCHQTIHVKSFPMNESYPEVNEDVISGNSLAVPLTNPYTAMIKVTDSKGKELFYNGLWDHQSLHMTDEHGVCQFL